MREMVLRVHAAEAANKPKKKALGADTRAPLPRGPRVLVVKRVLAVFLKHTLAQPHIIYKFVVELHVVWVMPRQRQLSQKRTSQLKNLSMGEPHSLEAFHIHSSFYEQTPF